MDGQDAIGIKLDQNELAAPAYTSDSRAFELSFEMGSRERRDQLWQFDFRRNDAPANDNAAQGAHDVLDFRKLRHVVKCVVGSAVESTRAGPRSVWLWHAHLARDCSRDAGATILAEADRSGCEATRSALTLKDLLLATTNVY